MILRVFPCYDLLVTILDWKGRAWTDQFRWIVRPRDLKTEYMIETEGRLLPFVCRKGWCSDEQTAVQTASNRAVQIARARVRPFAGRYLDHLCKIDLGVVVEEER